MALRRALFRAGLRFRLRARMKLPAAPDVVFPGSRVAVFVDGCFWHGCPLHASWPKTHKAFWARKIRRNHERDRATDAALAALGCRCASGSTRSRRTWRDASSGWPKR